MAWLKDRLALIAVGISAALAAAVYFRLLGDEAFYVWWAISIWLLTDENRKLRDELRKLKGGASPRGSS
jgi:hypothetical protein